MSRMIKDLHPDVQPLCNRFIGDCADLGISVHVVQTLRSYEEQELIYAQGRTRPGPIATHARAGYSWHNFGRAFDICFRVQGNLTWEGPWSQVGEVGEQVGLEWGGRWAGAKKDRPHFQYPGGFTLEYLRTNLMVPKIEGAIV